MSFERGGGATGGGSGVDGVTPHIGPNGDWFIDSTDTGVHAKGDKGDKGDAGTGGGLDLSQFTDGQYARADLANNRLVGTDTPVASLSDTSRANGLGLWTPTHRALRPATGVVADDCQSASGWTSNVPTLDLATTFRARPTLKFPSAGTGTGTTRTFKKAFSSAVNMSPSDGTTPGHYLRVTLATDADMDPATTGLAKVTIRLSSDNFVSTDAFIDGGVSPGLADQGWVYRRNTFQNIPIFPCTDALKPPSTAGTCVVGYASGKVFPNWSAITHMQVQVTDQVPPGDGSTAAKQVNVWVAAIEVVQTTRFPIAIQLDRATGTNFPYLRSVLAKYGIPFTIASNLGFVEAGQGDYTSIADLQKAANEDGMDAAIYDYRIAGTSAGGFLPGDQNFGKPTGLTPPQIAATVGVPWSQRSRAATEDAILQATRACRTYLGERAVPIMLGQMRKLVDDGFDLVRRYFVASNMPSSGGYPQPYPLANQGRFHSFMWVNSAHDATTLYEDAIRRAAMNREAMVWLFHDIVKPGDTKSGFAIDTVRLDSLIQLAQSLGAEFTTMTSIVTGRA